MMLRRCLREVRQIENRLRAGAAAQDTRIPPPPGDLTFGSAFEGDVPLRLRQSRAASPMYPQEEGLRRDA